MTRSVRGLLLVIVTLGASCSDAQEHTVPLGNAEVPQAQVPVAGLVASPSEAVSLAMRVEADVQSCMSGIGFSYETNDRDVLLQFLQFDESQFALAFGFPSQESIEAIEDLGQATLGTYEPANGFVDDYDDAERSAWYAGLLGETGSEAELDRSDGLTLSVPSRGCMAEGRADGYGDASNAVALESLPSTFRNAVLARTLALEEVVDSQQLWSECVTETGYEFASPEELAGAFARGSAPMSSNEAFVLDQECGERSGLFRIGWNAVEESVEIEQPRFAAQIEQYRSVLDQ